MSLSIVHIVDEPYDSGIVQYALRAAAGLAARGHRCRVWAVSGGYPAREAERLGLPVETYSHPWLELPRLRRSLREGTDLVAAHTGSGHTLAVAAASWHRGRERGVPVLRTRGDARPLRRRPGGRLLWSRTAAFAAANRRILSEFERLYGGLGIPAVAVYEGMADPGPAAPPPSGPPTIGIVARLDPVKGHRVLLEAAARVLRRYPDARFVVAGRSENVSAADLEERSRILAIESSVEILGHVPDAFELMRRCHAGVVASVGSEAVCRAAVEWMACGRPLAASRVGCLPEYVEQGETGLLVPPADADALAEALGRLIADPLLRERMGRAARARYESRFTLERFLDETEGVYEQVVHAVPS